MFCLYTKKADKGRDGEWKSKGVEQEIRSKKWNDGKAEKESNEKKG